MGCGPCKKKPKEEEVVVDTKPVRGGGRDGVYGERVRAEMATNSAPAAKSGGPPCGLLKTTAVNSSVPTSILSLLGGGEPPAARHQAF